MAGMTVQLASPLTVFMATKAFEGPFHCCSCSLPGTGIKLPVPQCNACGTIAWAGIPPCSARLRTAFSAAVCWHQALPDHMPLPPASGSWLQRHMLLQVTA